VQRCKDRDGGAFRMDENSGLDFVAGVAAAILFVAPL
jgi:hypothetical protein